MRIFTEEFVKDLIELMGIDGVKKFAQAHYDNLSDDDREFARLFSMEANLLNLFNKDNFKYAEFRKRLDLQLEFVKFCVEHNLQLGYYYHEGDLGKKSLNEPLMIRKMIHTSDTNMRLLSLNDRDGFLSEEHRRDLEQGMMLLAKVDSAYLKDTGIRDVNIRRDVVYQSYQAVRKEYETPQMMVRQYMASLKASQAGEDHNSKKEKIQPLVLAPKAKKRVIEPDLVIDQESLENLSKSIGDMRYYGCHLRDDEGNVKGVRIVALCKDLDNIVSDMRDSKTLAEINGYKKLFSDRLKEGSKGLEIHRKEWKTYVANVFIALTGVGVFVLVGRAIYGVATEDSLLFFGKTKSKKFAEGIETRLEKFSPNKAPR